jgi:RNA polymerase sigma-70 factor, ECF subfamily
MDGSDDQALARARAGDREGFRLLVERHSRGLFRLAHRMTGNEHDAEDVVQEAFLRAYKRLDQFEDRSQVGSWLFRIAANCAYDLLRARQRRSRHFEPEGAPGGADAVTAVDAGPERLAAGSDVRRGVEAAMSEMSDRERSAFALRHFEGWSIAEIGVALGLDESATKQSIFRAVRKARAVLAPLARVSP